MHGIYVSRQFEFMSTVLTLTLAWQNLLFGFFLTAGHYYVTGENSITKTSAALSILVKQLALYFIIQYKH
jgi:hypothetical protein